MKIESMDAASLQTSNTYNTDHHTDTINSDNSTKIETKVQKDKKDNKSPYPPSLPDQEKKDLSISDKAISEAVEKANKAIIGGKTQFKFSVHEKTNEIMVKVIDSETQKVIREIPPEKILDIVAKMWELAGIMVDERR